MTPIGPLKICSPVGIHDRHRTIDALMPAEVPLVPLGIGYGHFIIIEAVCPVWRDQLFDSPLRVPRQGIGQLHGVGDSGHPPTRVAKGGGLAIRAIDFLDTGRNAADVREQDGLAVIVG